MKVDRLLIRKMIIAFLVAFFGALITTLTGLSSEPEFNFTTSIIISAIVGALSAGVRAVLALSPINITPSDAQHSLGTKKEAA